jgi:predicted TIM-barrel fold metal-dependent hydrolase
MRETHKDYLVLVLAHVREQLAIVGGELADVGLLAQPEDVFFLDLAQARAALAGTDLRAVIEQRKEEHQRELWRRQVPRVMLSDGAEFVQVRAGSGGGDTRLAGQYAGGEGTPVGECEQDPAQAAVSQHGADHRQIRIPAASRDTGIRVVAQRHPPTLIPARFDPHRNVRRCTLPNRPAAARTAAQCRVEAPDGRCTKCFTNSTSTSRSTRTPRPMMGSRSGIERFAKQPARDLAAHAKFWPPVNADAFRAAIESLRLVDHHVHGAMTDVADASFEAGFSESPWRAPAGTTHLDSQVGFAVRRWCSPVLDLPPHADATAYLARRRELGAREVSRRFLAASGVGWFLVETGYGAEQTLEPVEMARVSGAAASEIVRLESVAEQVVTSGVTAADFADRFASTLEERARRAVGLKSVIAYRYGLDFDPEPPSAGDVRRAAGQWLRQRETGESRLTDPILLRHLLWIGAEHRLPMQFHVGYGDPDLTLHRCNPSLMTGFLRLIHHRQVPVMLLHCYPYHRTAGYLAQVFPHVYLDVGLAVNYTGARSRAVVAESLELAPFGKLLFSSDAWGPAELHYLGAVLWRSAMATVLGEWVESGEWSGAEALRVAQMVGADNAKRVYRLPEWE